VVAGVVMVVVVVVVVVLLLVFGVLEAMSVVNFMVVVMIEDVVVAVLQLLLLLLLIAVTPEDSTNESIHCLQGGHKYGEQARHGPVNHTAVYTDTHLFACINIDEHSRSQNFTHTRRHTSTVQLLDASHLP
jgi:hypothetical protein